MRVEKTSFGYRAEGRIGRIRALLARSHRLEPGRWGEWVALQYLLASCWDVVARNWKSRRGEIDLVAYDGCCLVFVEVKSRRGSPLVLPEEQISPQKEVRLERLAEEFCFRHQVAGGAWRFDLIAVQTPDSQRFWLNHYVGFM